MIKATFTSNFDENSLAQMVRDKALEVAKARSQSMRCAKHGGIPDITLKGDKLNISGCCQGFAAEIGRAVRD
jgi:hypothetical protein